jgi:plastocyanin
MTSPMRWDCKQRGQCFNKKKRPKIEAFNDCFPGKIGFGDIDAAVEIEGNELRLEFKPEPVTLDAGQRIAFQRMTFSSHITAILLAGDAEPCPPNITHMGWYVDGAFHPWGEAGFDDVCAAIKSWVAWAKANPKRNRKPQIGASFVPAPLSVAA